MRRVVIGALLWLPLAGCFDYEERLRVHPTGAVDSKIHTMLPPWLRALPQASEAFYPPTATALTQKLGNAITPVFTAQGGEVDGFHGRVPAIGRLDTRLIRHELVFAAGGAYSLRVTLNLSPEFADAISTAVAQRAAAIPKLPFSNRERLREASLDKLGYRLEVDLPGKLTATNGHASGSVVSWKVPLRQLMAGKPVELKASGQLTPLERIARKIEFPLSF